MIGGDSRILTEKDTVDCSANKKSNLTSAEMSEAKSLVAFLNTYAERNITRQVDADDLNEAAASAFSREDIELLRAYKHSVAAPFFDVFVTYNTVKLLRTYGYTPISEYFTKDTEAISQKILITLMGVTTYDGNVFAEHNADKICAYAMSHPDKAVIVENIIRERDITSFDRIMAFMNGGVENSLMDGVL